MTLLALLLAGFSIFSAISLALTHFRNEHYPDKTVSRVMGIVLLAALAGLQVAHIAWLNLDQPWISMPVYRMMLFTVAPAFFLFSQPLLRPLPQSGFRPMLAAHALPIAFAPFLPADMALPLAFVVGAAYLLWLAHSLFALRGERASFRLEIVFLGTVFAIAVAVSLVGVIQASLPGKLFFSLYTCSIGMAFLLVQTTLLRRPQLSEEVSESVQAVYANSTLTNVDCDAALAKLDALMHTNEVFADTGLSMPNLAERLALSPHQLSELINSRLGKSFSRYLRERRIDAAKTMLLAEPSASVLSVGLSVGFTAQSNFYDAFREIEGMTPGQFRKLHLKPEASR